jgi:hypothetical protein
VRARPKKNLAAAERRSLWINTPLAHQSNMRELFDRVLLFTCFAGLIELLMVLPSRSDRIGSPLSLSLFAQKVEAFSSSQRMVCIPLFLGKKSCGAASCFHLPTFVFAFCILYLPTAYISWVLSAIVCGAPHPPQCSTSQMTQSFE